jgi:HEAT repeat protein
LKIEEFDKVAFLISLADDHPDSWRLICCQELSRFPDKRTTEWLCQILRLDEDPDVRCAAAESLAELGDETAISTLEYARKHDQGQDWEGFAVSQLADRAIRRIRSRPRNIRDN